MFVTERFILGNLLHKSARSEVWAAVCPRTRQELVLKQYAYDRVEGAESRAGREFKLLQMVAGCGIPRALELLTDVEGTPVLALERVSGLTLKSWAGSGAISVDAFLEVAIQLAAALARVHDARLLHRDVHPGNVLVDPATRTATLLDFGLARPLGTAERFGDGSSASSLSQEIAGVLPYVSPEQTGRMNRGIDSRSDLYSLGATLYHALVGRAPFQYGDPLSLIHAHMAKLPDAPAALRPDLPPAVSQIVLELMQKEPEDRYQTARGLLHDLQECLRQLRSTGRIDETFGIGEADAPLYPLFTKNMHGRAAEIEGLLGAL